jgi:murein L,D-transpeptidase YafK
MASGLNIARRNRFAWIGTTAALLGLALTGCQDDGKLNNARAYQPIPFATVGLMGEKGMTAHSPILVRSFKKEAELEIWKVASDGKYALLKTYPICRWSGQLGPKTREGDRQAPEGFYAITPALMNPNSNFYLSFDTGYPNAYDRVHGYRGSFLMVHGACSSRGCFSMTDEQIAEIYAVGREAFAGGQRSFQFQSYPFRMTAENMAKHRNDPNIAFWRMLKEGSDNFEVTRREPKVAVCGRRYVFNVDTNGGALDPNVPCPPLKVDDAVASAVAEKQREDNATIADLVAKGTPAVKMVYQDGGQHPSFRGTSFASGSVGTLFAQGPMSPRDVSRPEALEQPPQEIEIDHTGKAKPVKEPAKAVATAPLSPRNDGPSGASAEARSAAVTASLVSSKGSKASDKNESDDDTPFYKKLFGGGSSSSSEQPAAKVQQANVPLPPRRQSSGQAPAKPTTSSSDNKDSGALGWLSSLIR